MSKVTKRDNTVLDKELSLLLDSYVSSSLKRRGRSNPWTNGGGLPLTSWMAGAPKHSHSKILAVLNGTAKYPHRSYCEGSFQVFLRVVKNKAITDVQYLLILQTVSSYYVGKQKVKFDDYCIRDATYPTRSYKIFNEIYHMLLTRGMTTAPLNFLLSDKLTDLILMKCLYNEVLK